MNALCKTGKLRTSALRQFPQFRMLRFGLLVAFLCLVPPLSYAQEDKLLVAVAANVGPALQTLEKAFLASRAGAKIEFVLGSSGALATQIQNGAPFDLFLSADESFPKKLFDTGLCEGSPTQYALGRLILLSSTPLDFSEGLSVLKSSTIRQFAIANPVTAPYGAATVQALTNAGLWEAIKTKVVTAQSIAQASQYIVSGTGIGFVSKSALFTPELSAFHKAEGRHWIEVPRKSYTELVQSFVVVKNSRKNSLARAFAEFLVSTQAQAIFVQFGYGVPSQ